MLHKVIVNATMLLLGSSAIGELLLPSEMLAFVGIADDQQTNFLLRTTAVALLALLPGLWSAHWNAASPDSRNALFGAATYMFLSSAVDYQAFTQGIVNSMAVPSVIIRSLWGIVLLWLVFRRASK